MPAEEFVKVAELNEVPPGTIKTVEAKGQSILLANVEGRVYAMGAICTHAGWDLSEGTLEGKVVTCAGHGTKWDLETGQGKFFRPVPPEPVYQVKVEGSSIYVKL